MFDIKVEKLSKGLDFLSIDYDHNLINKFIVLVCFEQCTIFFVFERCLANIKIAFFADGCKI